MRKIKDLGFTLIELLVVISIIGILTTLVAANLNSARSRARDAARKSDIRNLATALRLYYNDWGNYPAAGACSSGVAGFCMKGCNNSGAPISTPPSNVCDWGTSWSNGTIGGTNSTVYMAKLPQDPLPGQGYYYTTNASGYTLTACLENTSDTSGTAVPSARCSSQWAFVFQQ